MLKKLAMLSACLLVVSCSSTIPLCPLPNPPVEAMSPLGQWNTMSYGMSEEEAVLVLTRNQELSLEWRYKATLLQDYVRKINE